MESFDGSDSCGGTNQAANYHEDDILVCDLHTLLPMLISLHQATGAMMTAQAGATAGLLLDPGSLADQADTPNGGVEERNNAFDELPGTFFCIDDTRLAQEFIEALKHASHGSGYLADDEADGLLNPAQEPLDLSEDDYKDLLLCLRLVLDQFIPGNLQVLAIKSAHPDDKLLSYDQIMRCIAKLSGVKPVASDKCPNSCMAHTGPLSQKNSCIHCGSVQYDPITGKCRQQFWSIPIGPIVPALRRNHKSAVQMYYLMDRLEALLIELRASGSIGEYDNIARGNNMLTAYQNGLIKQSGTVLMISFEGAQLYRNQVSDCQAVGYIYGFSPTSLPVFVTKRNCHSWWYHTGQAEDCGVMLLSRISAYQSHQSITCRRSSHLGCST